MMIPKVVKKHILEEMAHGKPIQLILNPPPPMVWGKDENGDKAMVPSKDWVKPDLPDWNIVVQWLTDDEAFRAAWTKAREFGAAYMADEMLVLKAALLNDPKSAPAYKVAMDMVKTSAMWRDPKYSDRVVSEVLHKIPTDPATVQARITQLREELGIVDNRVIDVKAVEVVLPKLDHVKNPKRVEAMERARAVRAANLKKRRDAKPDS